MKEPRPLRPETAPPAAAEPLHPVAWTTVRLARPARDLARSARFYGDLMGLRRLGGFDNHDGYDGVFFALPGGAELELTSGPAQPAPSSDEDLLVLFVQTWAEVAAIGARLTAAGVTRIPNRNPYWNRSGLTFLDPDGYRLVIAAGSVPDPGQEPQAGT
jgi:catechol 2,3-dioxygenase-like lactoylglutathione lyase family enzyme